MSELLLSEKLRAFGDEVFHGGTAATIQPATVMEWLADAEALEVKTGCNEVHFDVGFTVGGKIVRSHRGEDGILYIDELTGLYLAPGKRPAS